MSKTVTPAKVVAKNDEAFLVMPVNGSYTVFPITPHTSFLHQTEEAAMYALNHYFSSKELNAFFS